MGRIHWLCSPVSLDWKVSSMWLLFRISIILTIDSLAAKHVLKIFLPIICRLSLADISFIFTIQSLDNNIFTPYNSSKWDKSLPIWAVQNYLSSWWILESSVNSYRLMQSLMFPFCLVRSGARLAMVVCITVKPLCHSYHNTSIVYSNLGQHWHQTDRWTQEGPERMDCPCRILILPIPWSEQQHSTWCPIGSTLDFEVW